MAQVINASQVKLNSGQTIQAQQGGWYDGQQFWGGTLSQPGQINTQSNQPGAGQQVSQEVIAQTNPANVAYINAQRQQAGLTPSPATGVPAQPQPTSQPTPQPAQQPTPSVPGGSTAGLAGMAQPTINLPQLYEGLYASSGIRDIESDLTNKTNQYNDQIAKIKDNPYLSEATMTGRVKKLEEKFSADTRNIQNTIAMRKADIETQLNLQTKQFDINNAQTKLAWDQFNTLLSNGSLDNASGEDIAQLTRATGISSSMIQSAIGVSQKKNAPKVNTQVIQIDDGTNVSAVVLNQDTGEVISRQVLSASKPKAASVADQKTADAQQTQQNLTGDVQRGATLRDLINHYGVEGGLTVEQIYRIYNSNSPYGAAKEDIEDVKEGKFVS